MKQIVFDWQMNHSRMWRAWRSLVLFYLATNMTLTVRVKAILKPPHTSNTPSHWVGGQNKRLRRCFVTLGSFDDWIGGFVLCLILWTLNTCTPKVTAPSTVMHTNYPRSVLFFSFGLSPLPSELVSVSCYLRLVSHWEASADRKPHVLY